MCGLVTILAPEPQPDLGDLAAQMLSCIAHRGPDGSAIRTFSNRALVDQGHPATLALAHARLAIQDITDSGLQPMATTDGKQHISFNGEIYNFHELRHDLKKRGVQFHTRTDTEVALHYLTHFATAALNHFDGMFALFFLNLDLKTLLVARDPFGIKPMYHWAAPSGHQCFVSEIKALTKHPEWAGSIQAERAVDYLNRGIIDHTYGTLFEGVAQLPPGALIEIDLDNPSRWKIESWYRLEQQPPRIGSVLDLLRTSVERRLRSDVPVGSCLSGGIDSSAVVALAAHAQRTVEAAAPLHAIHARARDAGLDESAFAQLLAESAPCRLHVIEPQGSELFDRLDEVLWAQDEPFGSPSIFAQFKVFEHAHQLGIKVMLDGQGADETFGGYHAFFKAVLAEHLLHGRIRSTLTHAQGVARLHQVPMLQQAAQALACLLPPGLRSIGRPSPIAHLAGWRDPFDHAPRGWCSVRAFSLDQIEHFSLPMLLHWEDRNSMHFGIEARIPFLASELVELAFSLNTNDKIDAGLTKVALRNALRSIVPDPILDRNDKIAFATPQSAWLQRDPRIPLLLERGLEAAAPWITDAACTRTRAQTRGDLACDNSLWRLICFGAWRERFSL